MKGKKYSSLLGLAFDGESMKAVLLQRSGHRVRCRQALQVALSLNPVSSDPNLAGREIRNHLSEAGIRERHCVVCVPLQWALIVQSDLPDLPESDQRSYLELQAERRFPFALEDLSLAINRCQAPDGSRGATLAAIPRQHITALQKTLHAAKLRPVGITFGITSLCEFDSIPQGTAVLVAGNRGIDFAIAFGRGLLALRSIGTGHSVDSTAESQDTGEIVRQIRITLGLLPAGLQNAVRIARVFGAPGQSGPILAALQESAERLGFDVQAGNLGALHPALEGVDLPADASAECLAAALSRLLGRPTDFDFLPAQVSRLKQLTGRISSRGTRWLAASAAALFAVFGGLMAYQYIHLSRLESQWKAIEPQVKQLAGLQAQIRQFRPWFDASQRNLRIARALTEAFPEDGAVWAKSLEIRQLPDTGETVVSCSGKARSNREWLAVLDRLRKTQGIADLRFQQVRGEDPLQFTLTFRWTGGEGDGV
ncbi:MAG: hypothetical protein N3D11_06230 [Candidatus Sumerlaeia bacterium]|nr:hypothetical protein [Candidatus Sumerlaeia bacterium]